MTDEESIRDMHRMAQEQMEISLRREARDVEMYKTNLLAYRLRERQVKALEELVKEIKRLRITGIQP